MLFSRVVSFFALAMSFGGLAMANPVAEKRDLTAVENIVTALKSTTDSIVPQISESPACCILYSPIDCHD